MFSRLEEKSNKVWFPQIFFILLASFGIFSLVIVTVVHYYVFRHLITYSSIYDGLTVHKFLLELSDETFFAYLTSPGHSIKVSAGLKGYQMEGALIDAFLIFSKLKISHCMILQCSPSHSDIHYAVFVA